MHSLGSQLSRIPEASLPLSPASWELCPSADLGISSFMPPYHLPVIPSHPPPPTFTDDSPRAILETERGMQPSPSLARAVLSHWGGPLASPSQGWPRVLGRNSQNCNCGCERAWCLLVLRTRLQGQMSSSFRDFIRVSKAGALSAGTRHWDPWGSECSLRCLMKAGSVLKEI